MTEFSDSTNGQCRPNDFNRRLCVLTTLHAFFVTVLFCTGFVGIGLFSFITSQPIRWCPKLNNIFITYWLCLSLSILQVLLGLFFLVWLLFVTRVNKTFAALFGTDDRNVPSPEVFDQLRGSTPGQNSSTGSVRRNYPRLPSATQSVELPSPVTGYYRTRGSVIPACTTLAGDGKLPNYGDSSRRRCKLCSSQRRTWWLGFAGILLALLAVGLILGLVLVVSHTNYVTNDLTTDLTSLLVEAKQNRTPSRLDNVLDCWRELQYSLRCCGIANYSDWLTTPPQNPTASVPPDIKGIPEACFCQSSCPVGGTLRVSAGQLVYSAGCLDPVVRLFESQLLSVKVYLAGTLSLLVLTFLLDVVYVMSTAQATLDRLNLIQLQQPYPLDVVTNLGAPPGVRRTSVFSNPATLHVS